MTLTLAEKFQKATHIERREHKITEFSTVDVRKEVDVFNVWVGSVLTVVKITSFWDAQTKKPMAPPIWEELED